ncbi:Glucuronosyltransferase [Aphelenchoides bicaudatus]|nr:Glucuronosyltransferase [Aphelenchoides bicaudatus]
MRSSLFLLFLIVFVEVQGLELKNEPLRILVNSPSLGYSHLQFQGKLADLLVEAGHSVDVFNGHWIPFEDRTGTEKANFYATTPTRYHELDFFQNPFQNEDVKLDAADRSLPYQNTTLQFCIDIVNHPTMIKQLKSKNYDVFIGEMFDPCMFYVAELIGVRVKIVSSAISIPDEIAFAHGIPVDRSYIPSVFASSADVPTLSWKERAINLIIDIYYPQLLGGLTQKMHDFVQEKYKTTLPSFRSLLRSSSYVFVNVHDHFDHPSPVTRKIQYIGGIAIKQPSQEQQPNIETIFKQASKGVILISMGSIVDSHLMPLQLKQSFIHAFAQFPQLNVIWRFQPGPNDTALFAQAPNVFTVKWMDQTSILSDKRTKLFISHCGQNSAMEAAYSGTPVLALPLFADQNYNAALLTRRGMAIYQNVKEVTTELLVEKIAKLLNDETYQKNGEKLSRKLQDEPFKPSERFVKLVEYSARHVDGRELELYVTELNFIIRNNLDIYLPLFASIILTLYVFIKAVQFLIRVSVYLLSLRQKSKSE